MIPLDEIYPERDRHWPVPLSAVSSIPVQYGDRFVVAHAAKRGPMAVALAKAALYHSNACAESGKVPANEVVPAVRQHPGTRTRPNEEVAP